MGKMVLPWMPPACVVSQKKVTGTKTRAFARSARCTPLAQSTQAEADGDLSVMADRAEFLAPEIDLLLFRYFDGIEWMEEWDSEALGALPLAIEITIGFVPPPEDDVLRAAAAGSIPDSYRFVVALPLAESVDLESGL